MHKTLEIRGNVFNYQLTYEETGAYGCDDMSPITEFFLTQKTVERTHRKYWLFGPKLTTWSSEPDVLFSVDFHIDTNKLTTAEVRSRVERAHDIWKREADLKSGKLI